MAMAQNSLSPLQPLSCFPIKLHNSLLGVGEGLVEQPREESIPLAVVNEFPIGNLMKAAVGRELFFSRETHRILP